MYVDKTWKGWSNHGPAHAYRLFSQISIEVYPLRHKKKVNEGPHLQRSSSSDQNATATNRMHPRILNWNIAIVCRSYWFHKYGSHASDLLRNLTFQGSTRCTQVSDQYPLGLLLWTKYGIYFFFRKYISSPVQYFQISYCYFNLYHVNSILSYTDLCLEVLFSLPDNSTENRYVSQYTEGGHDEKQLIQYLHTQTHLDVTSLERMPSTPSESGFIIHLHITKLIDYDETTESRIYELLNSYFESNKTGLDNRFSCFYNNGSDCERHFGRKTIS